MSLEIKVHPWYHQRHHNGKGFRNIWEVPRQTSFFKALPWLLQHSFQQKENNLPPVQDLNVTLLAEAPEQVRITWIGHATTLIQTPTFTMLTDPVFGNRASPVGFAGPDRKVPPGLPREALPPLDIVLLSHDHYDHLEKPTIQYLEQAHQPLFLAPLGVGKIIRQWGATRVVELDWWHYIDLNEWRFHCTPARHFSGRGVHNRNGTLWASWYLESLDGAAPIYYAGDSGYAAHFTEIRDRLGAPQVALIPIGAYLPRWLMQEVHVEPREAVQAFLDLQAQHFIPIHWGTFDLADEPMHEPPNLIRQFAADENIAQCLHVLDIGGVFSFPAVSS